MISMPYEWPIVVEGRGKLDREEENSMVGSLEGSTPVDLGESPTPDSGTVSHADRSSCRTRPPRQFRISDR